MKIIKVNKPYQGSETKQEEKQLIDDQYPNWVVHTEMAREKDGGFLKWFNTKEAFVNEKSIKGIYLYNITALYQEIVGDGMDIIYYIRYAYIK